MIICDYYAQNPLKNTKKAKERLKNKNWRDLDMKKEKIIQYVFLNIFSEVSIDSSCFYDLVIS